MDDASADLLRAAGRRLGDRPWLVLVTRARRSRRLRGPTRAGQPVSLRPRAAGPSRPRSTLVQRALATDHPLPPHALDAARAPRRRQPAVPRGARAAEAARSGSAGATCPSRWRVWSPARSTGWTRRTGRCCATPPCSGRTVDEAALTRCSTSTTHELDGGALEPAGRLPGARPSRAAAVPQRPHPRRGLRGAPVQAAQARCTTRSGARSSRRPPTPEAQCELLSLHFFHAGAHEQAWRYSVLAGERAVAKFAHGEAIDFFARAVQSVPRGAAVDARRGGQGARAAGRLPVPARHDRGVGRGLRAGPSPPARRPGATGRDHREGGADRPSPPQVQPVDASAHPWAARPGGGPRWPGGRGAVPPRPSLRLQPLQPGPDRRGPALGGDGGTGRRGGGRQGRAGPGVRDAERDLRRLGTRGAVPVRPAGPAGLHRAGQPAAPGPLPEQPRRPGVHARRVERGAGQLPRGHRALPADR